MRTFFKFCISLFFSVMLVLLSCNSPTEPGVTNPREYTWTITQIAYPGSGQTRMFSIWGTNPNNVYVCGFSFLSGQKGAAWHFDGNQWKSISLPSPDYNYLSKVIGFDEHDVWIVGSQLYVAPSGGSLDSAVVLRFDGTQWTQVLPSHLGVRGLQAIGGSTSQNLFFGSRDGKIIHYNGTVFDIDTLYSGVSIRSIGGDEALLFAVGNTVKGSLDDSVLCFIQSQNNWDILGINTAAEIPSFGNNTVFSPVPGVYFSSGYLGVFRWDENKWVKVFSPLASLADLGGTSPTNLIAIGQNEAGPALYHYDGLSWKEIKLPEGLLPKNVSLSGVWTDGKEAFIVGGDGAVSYILHGE